MKFANLHLVTGYAVYEHVTAADQGAFNVALLGSGQFVINKGNKLAASVVTNNKIRISDGDIYMQGRFIRLNEGGYADLVIENGTQGYQRNDLIVARYTKAVETGIEEVNLVVIKGTAVASNPKDPSYSSGNIIEGKAYLNDMPLYRVAINGLTVQSLVPLFTVKSISCVSKDGDTMTKALNITNGTNTLTLNRADFGVIIEGFLEGEYNTFRRYLGISNRSARPNGNESLRYNIVENGSGVSHAVFHQGNKPKGSYTGNGSAASRTIQTGGIGNMLIIWSTTGKAFVTPGGGLYSIGTTITNFAVNVAKFENGELTLITTDQTMNTNGQTYHYQVL
jgi:hypothetical protein